MTFVIRRGKQAWEFATVESLLAGLHWHFRGVKGLWFEVKP
jgi:hypothetical protein